MGTPHPPFSYDQYVTPPLFIWPICNDMQKNMQNMNPPHFYMYFVWEYVKYNISANLRSGLTPGVRPDLRFTDMQNMRSMRSMRNMSKYVMYVECDGPVAALTLRWTRSLAARRWHKLCFRPTMHNNQFRLDSDCACWSYAIYEPNSFAQPWHSVPMARLSVRFIANARDECIGTSILSSQRTAPRKNMKYWIQRISQENDSQTALKYLSHTKKLEHHNHVTQSLFHDLIPCDAEDTEAMRRFAIENGSWIRNMHFRKKIQNMGLLARARDNLPACNNVLK